MNEIHLNTIDLNLLLVFSRIYIRQNLTEAAEDLGRTQSALSHALERLRQLFNDPLFVRTSKKMKPTKRAEELAKPIKEALLSINNVFKSPSQFSAESLKRTFTISMSDYCQVVVLPRLMNFLFRNAPGVDIKILPSSSSELQKNLESGIFDLIIGNKDLGSGIMQQVLFEDEFVCMVNDSHDLSRGIRSIEDFTRFSHILFTTKGKGDRLVEQTLKEKGIQRKVAIRVPNVLVIPKIIQYSPYIVTLPKKLAESLDMDWVKILRPPIKLPKLPIFQYWHTTSHNEPTHSWFRKSIQDLFSSSRTIES
ncbi:LysR family transcriptional regulator [bacterium]|nr:LysR family transcriptional regulator [bacterium]